MNDSYVRVTACCGRSMKPLLSVTNDCDRSRCHRQKKKSLQWTRPLYLPFKTPQIGNLNWHGSLTPAFPWRSQHLLRAKSDLRTGWGAHYARKGDISVQRSGEDPEVLQMHSGFLSGSWTDATGKCCPDALGTRNTADWPQPHDHITHSQLSRFVLETGDSSPSRRAL